MLFKNINLINRINRKSTNYAWTLKNKRKIIKITNSCRKDIFDAISSDGKVYYQLFEKDLHKADCTYFINMLIRNLDRNKKYFLTVDGAT